MYKDNGEPGYKGNGEPGYKGSGEAGYEGSGDPGYKGNGEPGHYAEILSEFHQKCVLVLYKNLKIVCKYRTLFWRFIQGRLETI